MEYYIHQIGNMNEKNTYEKLIRILKSRMIASRAFLEKNGMQFDYDNTSFKLDIQEGKNGCTIMMIFIKTECHYQILKIDLLKKQLNEKTISL